MKSLILQPTDTAQWLTLLNKAQGESEIYLGQDIESYLVFMLMRFSGRPEFANSVLALDFYEAMQELATHHYDSLQDVGDKCLLFSGLFPDQAKQRQVSVSYFIELGQHAYHAIALREQSTVAQIFSDLSEQFPSLTDVLQAMRPEA